MATARYHREQGKLCLDIARLMSDRDAADRLRATAVRHFTQSVELEKLGALSQTADKHPGLANPSFPRGLSARGVR